MTSAGAREAAATVALEGAELAASKGLGRWHSPFLTATAGRAMFAQGRWDEADVLLVVGSSLTVHPAAGLVPYAGRLGTAVIIVNAEPTDYDRVAAAVLREPIVEVVPALLPAPPADPPDAAE